MANSLRSGKDKMASEASGMSLAVTGMLTKELRLVVGVPKSSRKYGEREAKRSVRTLKGLPDSPARRVVILALATMGL
jgi:hypothetical protein